MADEHILTAEEWAEVARAYGAGATLPETHQKSLELDDEFDLSITEFEARIREFLGRVPGGKEREARVRLDRNWDGESGWQPLTMSWTQTETPTELNRRGRALLAKARAARGTERLLYLQLKAKYEGGGSG